MYYQSGTKRQQQSGEPLGCILDLKRLKNGTWNDRINNNLGKVLDGFPFYDFALDRQKAQHHHNKKLCDLPHELNTQHDPASARSSFAR